MRQLHERDGHRGATWLACQLAWQLAWRLAATAGSVLVHEAGHFAAAAACRLYPRVELTPLGARTVYRAGATPRQNAAITLAGPLAQAGFVLARRRDSSALAVASVAIASLARNIAPVPSADGDRLWGRHPATTRPRWIAYWTASSGCALAAVGTGSVRPLTENGYIFDLYLRAAREWTGRLRFHMTTRGRGLSL
ncbi:MAG TPA: hypothetical protein VHO01_04575 [Jatrophihabitans sp.]|nr:hypothetical protein [Jatrophihabitans sp.]